MQRCTFALLLAMVPSSVADENPAPVCTITQNTKPGFGLWDRVFPDVSCEIGRTWISGGNNEAFSFYGGELDLTNFDVCSDDLGGSAKFVSFGGPANLPSLTTELDDGVGTLGPFGPFTPSELSVYMKIVATANTEPKGSPKNQQSVNLNIKFYDEADPALSGSLKPATLSFAVGCGYGNLYVFGIKFSTLMTLFIAAALVLSFATCRRKRGMVGGATGRNGQYGRLDNADGGDETHSCQECRFRFSAATDHCPMCGAVNDSTVPPPYIIMEGSGEAGGEGDGSSAAAVDGNATADNGGGNNDADAAADDDDDALLNVDAAAAATINNSRGGGGGGRGGNGLPEYSESAPALDAADLALPAYTETDEADAVDEQSA